MLRKIYGSMMTEEGCWRTNEEIRTLYREPTITVYIIKQRIRRLGHIQRLQADRMTNAKMQRQPIGRKCRTRSRNCWFSAVMEDLKTVVSRLKKKQRIWNNGEIIAQDLQSMYSFILFMSLHWNIIFIKYWVNVTFRIRNNILKYTNFWTVIKLCATVFFSNDLTNEDSRKLFKRGHKFQISNLHSHCWIISSCSKVILKLITHSYQFHLLKWMV